MSLFLIPPTSIAFVPRSKPTTLVSKIQRLSVAFREPHESNENANHISRNQLSFCCFFNKFLNLIFYCQKNCQFFDFIALRTVDCWSILGALSLALDSSKF